MQPKVVVKVGLGGSTANLQCTAWNGNINVNQAQGYGYVSFSLTVEKISFFIYNISCLNFSFIFKGLDKEKKQY